MRGSVAKLIFFVVLPVLVLIIAGGIYLLKIKPIRYAFVDHVLKYSFNKSVKEGRLTREDATKLQYALRGLVRTVEEADLTKEEKELFNQEGLRLGGPLEKLEKEEELTDEDVQKIVDAIREMELKIIEIVKKRGKDNLSAPHSLIKEEK